MGLINKLETYIINNFKYGDLKAYKEKLSNFHHF